MIVINIRSPYLISVADFGGTQVSSRITLSFFKKGVTPPTSGAGFYSLSKKIASPTQRLTYYNISNFAKEFIENYYSEIDDPVDEDSRNYTYVEVKRYWSTSSAETLIDTTTYFCLNGFNEYLDGRNFSNSSALQPLFNNQISKLFDLEANDKGYLNVFFQKLSAVGQKLDAVYYIAGPGEGGNPEFTPVQLTFSLINGSVAVSEYFKKFPIAYSYDYTGDGNNTYWSTKVTLNYYGTSPYTTPTQSVVINTVETNEYKYNPIRCTFVNRYGGWDNLFFFKNKTESIAIKNTKYAYNQSAFSYDTSIGQSKLLNVNGKQSIKLNTGWVNENVSELITDLLLSETVLLDNKPVILKTQNYDVKSVLKDKMINYEIEFEYNYNLINDVV